MTSALPAASLSDQVPLVPWRVNCGACLPIAILLMLALYGFENGIQIQVIAKIHEFLAQHPDMQTTRHIHDHLYRKHRSAGMRSRVGARRKFGDVDAALREEPRKSRDDAGLVEAH